VATALDQLDQDITNLHAELGSLLARLSDVVGPQTQTEDDLKDERIPTGSPLAQALYKQAARTREMLNAVLQTQHRLEL